MPHPILVTAAIIEAGEKILIAKRKHDTFMGGSWEFPGGKVDFGEDPKDSIVREMKEEMDLDIEDPQLLHLTSHVYHRAEVDLHVIILFYVVKRFSGDVSHIQCQDSCWVDPQTIDRSTFLESNQAALDMYLQQR